VGLVTGSGVQAVKTWSLRNRLVIFAVLSISFVLIIAGMGIAALYKAHVEDFVLTELTSHSDQLLGISSLDGTGKITVDSDLSDPRFQQPGGGLYWQIDVEGQTSLRSRSLWDESMIIPTPPGTEEEEHAHILVLPNGNEIFAMERRVTLSNDSGREKSAVFTMGIDRTRITTPIGQFLRSFLGGLLLTYVALLLSMIAIIWLSLRPLISVKAKIADMRAGNTVFNPHDLPSEILPLANEVNALSAAREVQLQRARERASNLAHGLKTPLAVMQAIANELRQKGMGMQADGIAMNASQMRDLVDRELTRSRIASGHGNYKTPLAATLQRVLATMKKAPRGDRLAWEQTVPETVSVAMDQTDLLELVGNIIDNGRKHASSTVRLSFSHGVLTVEDDGRGVPEDHLASIMQRGVRLDEKSPGSGIGLAIVADLSEVYGLTVTARRSDLGGLALDIRMPQA
jgi:signal transduction histidine kinase